MWVLTSIPKEKGKLDILRIAREEISVLITVAAVWTVSSRVHTRYRDADCAIYISLCLYEEAVK